MEAWLFLDYKYLTDSFTREREQDALVAYLLLNMTPTFGMRSTIREGFCWSSRWFCNGRLEVSTAARIFYRCFAILRFPGSWLNSRSLIEVCRPRSSLRGYRWDLSVSIRDIIWDAGVRCHNTVTSVTAVHLYTIQLHWRRFEDNNIWTDRTRRWWAGVAVANGWEDGKLDLWMARLWRVATFSGPLRRRWWKVIAVNVKQVLLAFIVMDNLEIFCLLTNSLWPRSFSVFELEIERSMILIVIVIINHHYY